MAITDNRTAIAAHTLLTWLMPSLVRYGRSIPDQADAIRAAEVLAEAARKLQGGPGASRVREAVAVDGARLAMLAQRREE